MISVRLTIPDTTTIEDALAALAKHRANVAAVVDADREPIGVVTRFALQAQAEQSQACIRHVTVPVFFSVRSEARADNVLEEIRNLGLQSLFVIAENHRVAGIICQPDHISSQANGPGDEAN